MESASARIWISVGSTGSVKYILASRMPANSRAVSMVDSSLLQVRCAVPMSRK
jgi:hypothetical protein